MRTIVACPISHVENNDEERKAKLSKSQKILNDVLEVLENDAVMKELVAIEHEEIETYKQHQKDIILLRNLIRSMKESLSKKYESRE